MVNFSLTNSTICRQIIEKLDVPELSIQNYVYDMGIIWIEREDMDNMISLEPTVTKMFDKDYNLNTYELKIEVQVFIKYFNTVLGADEWKREIDFWKVLDSYWNNVFGKITAYKETSVADAERFEHHTGQGTVYRFEIIGNAHMLTDKKINKGGNC